MEITLTHIRQVICEVCDIEETELKSRNRRSEFVTARILFCLLSRNWTEKTNDQIALFLNKSNGSVVSNNIKYAAKRLVNCDENFIYLYNLSRKKLQILEKGL